MRNVGIDLEDRNDEDPGIDVSKAAKEKAAKEIFEEHFLGPLGDGVMWVRLRGGFRVKYQSKILMFLTDMNREETRCDTLIETTAAALYEDAVALMLVAVQKDNLGLSVPVILALKRSVHQFKGCGRESHRAVQYLFQWI